MSYQRSTEEVSRERELFALLDADLRRQNTAYERERETDALQQVAEWRRITGIRDGDGEEPGRQIRQLIAGHAQLGRRIPVKLVALRRDELRRDLTLIEMWQCLQPDESDIAAGWALPERGASVSDVLPGCGAPETESAEASRRRQLDDWAGWNGAEPAAPPTEPSAGLVE